MPRASRPLATLALVALSGLVWGAAFAARPFLPLSFVALVPLLLALGRSRHPFLLGWWHGVLFWGSSMVWILGTLTTYGQLSGWLAGLSLLLMSLFLGSYTALFAGLGAVLWRSGGWRAVLGLPALWLVLEVARGHLFTGFPWNLAAYAWTRLPGALPLAAWIGAWESRSSSCSSTSRSRAAWQRSGGRAPPPRCSRPCSSSPPAGTGARVSRGRTPGTRR
ncbi:MAG: hypothetical protein R2862_11470 [Thermoanaerobaculia bacterium]